MTASTRSHYLRSAGVESRPSSRKGGFSLSPRCRISSESDLSNRHAQASKTSKRWMLDPSRGADLSFQSVMGLRAQPSEHRENVVRFGGSFWGGRVQRRYTRNGDKCV